MNTAFNTFHHGLIDYAGLFPPAELSLSAAMSAFHDYFESEDAWMLGSFVLPATYLPALEIILGRLTLDRPMSFSILPRPLATVDDVEKTLGEDLCQAYGLADRYPSLFHVESFELKLPTIVDSAVLIEKVVGAVHEEGFPGRKIYFECEFTKLTDEVLLALHRNEGACYKLRCGGIEASAYPIPQGVAQVIQKCRRGGVGMKFTAGLHHPVRHYSEAVGCKEFGFINVFGAVILAHEHDLSDEIVVAILTEENAQAFMFDELGFHWRDLSVGYNAIGETRNTLCHSYGSCSFDEPIDDLKNLGWMA